MPTPKIQVGVDEFTVVLQSIYIDDMELDDWELFVDDMKAEFLEKSKIEELFGKPEQATSKVQAGYNYGLTYTDRPWHFMIAWHDKYVKMGVCVKFSAFAYASYKQAFKEKYQQEINIATFLRMIQSTEYTTRLSRIDLTADYFDYPDPLNPYSFLDPDSIYRRLEDGSYIIKNYKEKSTIKSFSALHKNGAYETFYAGTKKGKTDGLLRCYDKKSEQMETHGFRFQEAEEHKSWVRFEASFKHNYAHQISEQLLQKSENGDYIIQTDTELQQLIAKHIVDKYCFYDTATDAPTTFSEELSRIVSGIQADALSRPNARDNSIKQSVDYLKKNSGLYATFYKVYEVWGEPGETKLLEHLKDYYTNKYKPKAPKKKDIICWLNKHREDLAKTAIEDSF